MKKKILIALGVLFAGLIVLCVVISLQPSTYSVQRSATIAAPPATVFGQVNDLKAWDAWSPWKKLDPNAKMTMSEPSAGKGATFSWAGNDQIGEGRMTILESRPDEFVGLEQVFVKPFAGRAETTFALAPEGSGTKVTWKLFGTKDFFSKAVCMLMDMDAMIGKDFEEGLANIKAVAEKSAEAPATATP